MSQSSMVAARSPKPLDAFSLVELSIVLVILGLLVGGILSGQSLIRAAQLRTVASEYQRYFTASQTFRDKYLALPGDMRNATSFWGAEPAANCPGDETTPSTTTATCNGNGDGSLGNDGGMGWSGAAGLGAESHRFWQHLANAGLIEGKYSGTHGAGNCGADGSCNITVGVTAPASRMSRAAWSTAALGNVPSGHPYNFAGSYGNVLYFGTIMNWSSEPAVTASEAWNIDTKIDDGKPGTGYARTYLNSWAPNCSDSDTPAAAVYRLSTSSVACAFIMPLKP